MEPTSLVHDAEFRLPPEFLSDDDFLVKKENKFFKGDESNLFPYELSHDFVLDSGLSSTKMPTGDEEESFLTGLTRKTVRSTQEDDFSGGFCAFPADKACGGKTRSPGIGCGRRNQNFQTRVSPQAAAWDLYSAVPRKHPLAAAKIPNDGIGYYSRQSLQYQKLQALQFQQLKQQQQEQLMQQSRGLKAANSRKIAGDVDLSRSAWSNQQPQRRDGSGMRAVFLGDGTGKPRSTGTGVFLPRRVNPSPETRERPKGFATVLIPARVAEVLNLDESVVQPSVRSSAGLMSDVSWREGNNNGGFSSQVKMEQTVNDPRLPSDWAY